MARILLIEPDRVLAQIYFRALGQAGHQVVPCASAQAGILAADQHKPDLVVLELQLVEHSGIEFLYEFRSYPDWQTAPVIVHTRVPTEEFRENLALLRQELGVATYLHKPQTSLKTLLHQVERVSAMAVA